MLVRVDIEEPLLLDIYIAKINIIQINQKHIPIKYIKILSKI